ncbi:phasin family protein [Micromonospora sp. H33]|uniref:phasin family protein n=1 Tax=Micromonospora sp. H33 TaxID=3452215 RepID=UPI003F8B7209
MQDAWRAYLELAMGLTEAPRKKAQEAVRRVVGTGGATAAQLQALAEELMSTSAANREALTKLVRFEVDRALGAVGLATADEVAELTRRVHELERQLREARTTPVSAAAGTGAAVGGPGPVAPGTAGEPTAGGPSAGAAEPATPPAAAAPTTTAGAPVGAAGAAPGPAPAKKAVAKKAVAKKVVAKKAVAKKAVAKKAVAKKAVATRPPADLAPIEDAPAPRPVTAPRKQQPGGAA